MSNTKTKKISTIILCAGSGTRTHLPYNKIFHFIGMKTVIELATEKFIDVSDEIICVCQQTDLNKIKSILGEVNKITYCIGGETRTDSVRCGLEMVSSDTDIVMIHDGARPFVKDKTIRDVIESAITYGSGVPSVHAVDAVKIKENDKFVSLDKNNIYRIQTPQAFNHKKLLIAYNKIGTNCGDDSELFEHAGYPVALVQGDYTNIKITTMEDLWKLNSPNIKIGVGFDAHQLGPNRKLILGGIHIPFDRGLIGHSDADVLIHAIMDAILSACNMPDIGVLFPEDNKEYLNINSKLLLERVVSSVQNKGYALKNISAVIIAQAPKLASYMLSMRENIALAVSLSVDNVNISATTTEHLGLIGEGKGIAASCNCLVEYKI